MALAALAGCALGATCDGAAASVVLVRSEPASALHGTGRLLGDGGSPSGMSVLLGSRARADVRVVTAQTRAIELDIAGGCRAGRLRLTVDAGRARTVSAGSGAWHTTTVTEALAGGAHRLRLSASYPRRHHGCAVTRVGELDFLPAAAAAGVVLGAAVRASNLSAPGYAAAFERYYGSLTPENEMKMEAAEPAPGAYDFGPADALVNLALAAGKQLRGHTLVYGNQLPGWVTSPAVPWTSESLSAVMRDYITTMMRHFAGRVKEWDVVNEAFNEDGGYRHNVWYDVIGPTYIEQAFRFARAADPAATLVYNDVREESANFTAIKAMAADFLRRGVPLDAIGLQNHTNLSGYPTQADLEGTIAAYAGLGLHVEITEMDVGISGYRATTEEALARQADAYRQAARACWALVACTRLTAWGVSDALSWIGSAQAPLPLDAGYAPKPAYTALVAALHLTG